MVEFNQKIICLLSDFGLKGQHYVASMKAVILNINPNIKIIDITHNISPYSVIEASYILKTTYKTFPKGTIFIIIVDPGVGSSREILLIKTKSNHYFIGPNNGIFSGVFINNIDSCIEIKNEEFFNEPISNIFHGRDIMAPIGAYLTTNIPLSAFGPKFNLNNLKESKLKYSLDIKNKVIQCSIQYIDSYGNGTTNTPLVNNYIKDSNVIIKEGSEISVKIGQKLYNGFFTSHFSSVPINSLLFLVGSTGFLELSLNQGNASEKLGFNVGDIITIKL